MSISICGGGFKNTVFEDGGVQNISRINKINICYAFKYQQKSLLKKLLPLKGRWIQKTSFFEDGGVFLA
ncbi:MAG: hypothetical protein IKT53_02130 [Bacteroidaceae bacterium]|nr:hypothetical protein [Bacteroidaceae bacterium]